MIALFCVLREMGRKVRTPNPASAGGKWQSLTATESDLRESATETILTDA